MVEVSALGLGIRGFCVGIALRRGGIAGRGGRLAHQFPQQHGGVAAGGQGELDPQRRRVDRFERQVRSDLLRRRWLRVHSFLLGLLCFLACWAISTGLMRAGVTGLALRWSLALAGGLALFLLLAVALHGSLLAGNARGDFYRIFPHGLMVSMFLPVFGFAMVALGMGALKFVREVRPATSDARASGKAAAEALHDSFKLRYLDGGHGEGCHNEDDAWTQDRKRFHHLTLSGFMLCFAATSVATLMHYGLHIQAPYGWFSLPKLLGITGGVLLVWGTAGLWRLRTRRHPDHLEPSHAGMDLGFIALLFLTGATGLVLMVLRTTQAMPVMLCLHLGAVLALFVTMPYGKFAHGVYRVAAMIRYSVEKRQPNRLGLSGE